MRDTISTASKLDRPRRVFSARDGRELGTFSLFLDGRTYWRAADGAMYSARDAKVRVEAEGR